MKPAFNSLSDFIAMGNHGTYVWLAWFIVVFGITLLIIISKIQRNHIKSLIHRQALVTQTKHQQNPSNQHPINPP